MEYVFGKNTIDSYIESKSVVEIFILKNFSDEKILNKIRQANIKVSIKDKAFFDKVANGGKHQGIIAIIKEIKCYQLQDILSETRKKESSLIVILDGIEDPHNFGAILRSADAFSVDGVIIKKHNQVEVNSTVMKTSAGASNFVKVAMVNNLSTAIEKLKENGFWVVSSDGSGTYDYQNLSYDFKTALVVGSEGFGISQLVLKRSDYIVKIPMTGHVNSLNASVACSIILSRIRN